MPTCETVIPCRSAELNLEEWLFSMSDADYQRVAAQHRALGTFSADGVRGMVNVEVMGHALIIQHYRQVTAGSSYVQMHSARSQAYLLHLYPVFIGVTWTMQITPAENDTATFTCTVDLDMPPILRLLARITGVTAAIRRHTREETLGFAADLVQKASEDRPGAGSSR
jgi:hypothetical protein